MLTEKNITRIFNYFGKKIEKKEINILQGKEKGKLNLSKYSEIYLNKIKKYSWIFRFSPFIEEVFVCNTVAFGSAKKESDIDLFIITKNGKIWTARFFLTVFIHFLGLRRYGKKTEGRFCLSFWATGNGSFSLKQIELQNLQDPYFALWNSTLIPILGNKKFITIFYKKNKWIKNYGINFINPAFEAIFKGFFTKKILENILGFSFFENFLKKVLKKRSLNKKKKIDKKDGVIISDDILKFHNKDKRKEIYDLIK